MKPGDTAFLIESKRVVREVVLVRNMGGLWLIRFKDTDGGIQVRESRLYATKEEAENDLPCKKRGPRSNVIKLRTILQILMFLHPEVLQMKNTRIMSYKVIGADTESVIFNLIGC